VLTGGGGGGRAGRGVLTGARAAVEGRRDGDKERWHLELSARAKDGTNVLGREGKKGR
jgi:hypothetical protein